MPLNVPMVLTWIRIVMIPLVVGVFFLPEAWIDLSAKSWLAGGFFVVAALTDGLDGYLARKLNQTSNFGAFLDPVADKLMVSAALIMLVYLDRTSPFIALIIIGREITISALREWMAQIGAHRNVAVNSLGKLKTAAQMGAIPMLLVNEPLFGFDLGFWGVGLIYAAAVFTVWSMLYYLCKAWPVIKEQGGV